MNDMFLHKAQARLELAQLLGVIDRRIRRSLREMSEGKLWELGRQVNRRIKELASLDSPGKVSSMGAVMRVWREYPLKKLLDEEGLRRYDERVAANPSFYLTPFNYMSNEELDNYIRWRRLQPIDSFDRLSVEEKYARWRKIGHRVLSAGPVQLPKYSDVRRRPPNNRERGGPAGPATKAADSKEATSPIPGPERSVSIPIPAYEVS